MQPLQCAAEVVGPALGAAAGLGRWFCGGAVSFSVCGDFQRASCSPGSRTNTFCGTYVYTCNGPPHFFSSLSELLGACLVSCIVFCVCMFCQHVGLFLSAFVCGHVATMYSRQHWETTAHRALPVCEWPALGMPLGTARPNAASSMCSRCGVTCTRGCGRAGGQLVCGGCGLTGLWRIPVEEAALCDYSAQTPTIV